MSSPRSDSDVGDGPGCPFLLKLFYKTGSYIRPEEFTSRQPPPHVDVYTHQSCTLAELAAHLTALSPPSPLPSSPVGTRLVFQLVYQDIRNPNPHHRRYLVTDLGSVVIGGTLEPEGADSAADAVYQGGKTLRDAKFVIGDYVSCVILPPLEDGSVAPASLARKEKHIGWENRRLSGGGGGARGGPGSGFGGSAAFPAGEWKRGERVPHAPTRPREGARRR